MSTSQRFLRCIFLVMAVIVPAFPQTTQGLIFGIVIDDVDRHPLAAKIVAIHEDSGAKFETIADISGAFAIPLLPPGRFTITAELDPYRPSRIESIELSVGGFVEQEVHLRLLTDLWQRQFARRSYSRDNQSILLFYGPDVDLSRAQLVETAVSLKGDIAPSLSYVAGPSLLERLPLSGRDAYTLIGLLPGVTNDLTTVRGVGVSVNGQRPSSGSFLLDGLENNNYLVSGPYSKLPPEAIGEYRISTNNFSAEYGRTSGYLANAVTRAGGNNWHGLAYAYLMDEALNGNDPARKQVQKARLPLRDFQQGLRVGGPILRERLFTSTLMEYWRQASWGDPLIFNVPTAAFVSSLPSGSVAASLLRQFVPPSTASTGPAGAVTMRQPTTSNRVTALQRIDWLRNQDRITGRFLLQREWSPDFIWSPYADFNSSLKQNATSVALTHVRNWNSRITTELRGGVGRDFLGWERAHPEIPQLFVPGVTLPGSPARYVFHNEGTSGELSGNVLVQRRAQFVKIGAGLLMRGSTSSFTPPSSAPLSSPLTYAFASLAKFAADSPSAVVFAAARDSALKQVYGAAETDRDYRQQQAFFFIQDSLRLGERLLVHLGIRYDAFGVPRNTGAQKDWLIGLGSGTTFPQRLAGTVLAAPFARSQMLYDRDGNDWAPRVGFALNLRREQAMVLRGSYGLFYDRPFDNLWQNLRFNNSLSASAPLNGTPLGYTAISLANLLSGVPVSGSFNSAPLTLYQPAIRTPYVQSLFLSLEERVSRTMLVRVAYAGSLGRKLITTDLVNRIASTQTIFRCPSGSDCRYNDSLNTDIDYRANQGTSSFHSGIVSLDYRSRYGELHAAYTLSHSIDNQSEPLAGRQSANLAITNLSPRQIIVRPSGFTAQFDSSIDRASSDFDQRHSFIFYSTFALPAAPGQNWTAVLTRNWRVSQLGAVRSGSPYSVFAEVSTDTLYAAGVPGALNYNRASLVPNTSLSANTGPVNGGQRLLNPQSFTNPLNQVGNTGRNAFAGPGSFNVDLSISRTFSLSMLGESGRVVLRGDAYNVFNHANLSNPAGPCAFLSDDCFGVATPGRAETRGAFFAAGPLAESARRIQLMLQIAF